MNQTTCRLIMRGDLCSGCGVYLGHGRGFPILCPDCIYEVGANDYAGTVGDEFQSTPTAIGLNEEDKPNNKLI